MAESREETERCRKQDDSSGGGRKGGRGVWDGLINRVSDSTRFCPWDESSRAHQRSAASGNCGQ